METRRQANLESGQEPVQALIYRIEDFFSAQASTRGVSLLRFLWPLMIWTRVGSEWILFRNLEPWRFGVALLFFAATTAMCVGFWSRLSTLVTGLLGAFFFYGMGHGMDVEPYTHHHTYLLFMLPLLLALTPCGASLSVDRHFALRRAKATQQPPPLEQGPDWGRTLIVLQTSAIYAFACWAKLEWGHLSGERMEHYAMHLYLGSDYPTWAGFHAMMVLLSVCAIGIEGVLAVGLFVKRWHRWVLPLGLLLHGVIYVTLPVGTFSVSMAALYLVVLDPKVLHGFIDRMFGHA